VAAEENDENGGVGMNEPIIQLKRVTKRYKSVLALNDVSLEVGPGITGLIGPNAAGKTTFLGLVTGLLKPGTGLVRVLGRDPILDTSVRGQIGFCPDGEAVWDWMDGFTFVSWLGICAGLGKKEARQRTEKALEELEMTQAAYRPVREYSKGMRQKVKLAQSMIHNPRVLVLDEPLNGVDPLSRHQITTQLRKLAAEDTAIIVSSHVLHELGDLVDEVVLLLRGRLLASGSVSSIRELMDEHPHTLRFTCDDPRRLASTLLKEKSVVSGEIRSDNTVDIRTRAPVELYGRLPEVIASGHFDITEMTNPDANLEAVFRYLVEGGK